MARQEHGSLPCGIAAADQHHVLISAEPRLYWGGPIPDAATFESLEVFDFGPPVARAARDHHRARPQRLATIELERKGTVDARAIERGRAHWNHDIRAELLRLRERAARQRLAGNAGRKPEIVFDTGASAGLSAERARIQNHYRKAFGGRIHGGRKTSRAAADDRGIVNPGPGRPADHADRSGELTLAGVAQHGAVGAHHQRPIRRRWRIARDQFGGVVVAFRVEQVMRKAVAGEKSLQTDDTGRVRRPDQHGAADAALDQADPA